MQTLLEIIITFLAILALGLIGTSSDAKAQETQLKTVPCPKIIAFPDWGQFTLARKNANIVCMRNQKEAKKSLSRCRKDCGPDFNVTTEELTEAGPANSPAISIRNKSGLLFYEYDGESSFSVDLIEFSAGKTRSSFQGAHIR